MNFIDIRIKRPQEYKTVIFSFNKQGLDSWKGHIYTQQNTGLMFFVSNNDNIPKKINSIVYWKEI